MQIAFGFFLRHTGLPLATYLLIHSLSEIMNSIVQQVSKIKASMQVHEL
jgi:hypothetical protein